MNTKFKFLAAILLSILGFQLSICFAQNTAFTYQGRFTDNGTPFSGTAEMQFTLWDAATNGTQVATTTPASTFVPVTNGLFAVPLDFGAAQFTGADRWIQIDARTTIGPFTTLQPRQKVTSTPYAIRAANLTGTLASNQLAGTYGSAVTLSNAGNLFVGTFAGSSAGLTNVNATTLGGFTAGQFWKTGGNAGANPTNGNFIGTTDDQPLEVKVNGHRVVRWERQTNSPVFGFVIPNIIGGFESNSVANGVGGATIAGGGGPQWYGDTMPHIITGSFSTIGGGVGNAVNSVVGTIAGGERGTLSPNAYNSFIGGGAWNIIDASDSTIGGGRDNWIQTNASLAAVGGGFQNIVGLAASASTIAGGYLNTIQPGATYATIGGGNSNTNSGVGGTIGGGQLNTASGLDATVAGGTGNLGNGARTVIAGGYFNTASGNAATVPGGSGNIASGVASFAAGRQAQALHDGAFVWADSISGAFSSTAANQFAIRASGGVRCEGDVSLEGGYRRLELTGGNALGYLYGSFPKWGDGIHLGYNYYADASGNNHVSNAGGGTSRITVGYGEIRLAVGGVNSPPATSMLIINTGGVCANGAIANCSDRNVKQNFAPVNPSDVLEKVIQLPVSAWSYTNTPAVRHVGPMAQDFYSAFNVGADDKHITTIDESGVALAAIQGLNKKLEAQRAENAELTREVAELKMLVRNLIEKTEHVPD